MTASFYRFGWDLHSQLQRNASKILTDLSLGGLLLIMINHSLVTSESSAGNVDATPSPANYSELHVASNSDGNYTLMGNDNTLPLIQNYDPYEKQGDPMVYILAVLSFYALSITVLLLKSLRSQRQDETDMYNYNEFIKCEGVKYVPPVNREDPESKKTIEMTHNYYPPDDQSKPLKNHEGVRITAV